MEIIRDPARIRDIKEKRYTTITEFPADMRDDSIGIRRDRVYGIRDRASISGISSFENRPVQIDLVPSEGEPRMFLRGIELRLDPELCVKGQNNIQLGDLKIVEHPLSFMTCMGVDFDLHVSEDSFPTFDYCNRPYLDAVRDRLEDRGPARFFTIREPALVLFEKGYCLLEPSEDSNAFIADHQVEYPGSSIGTARVVAEIDPACYAFFCAARTPSFRPREENRKNFEYVKAGLLKDYPITVENVLFVDEDEFYNPRSEFVRSGINHEFMMHEMIDITAWIKFLEVHKGGKFAGKMTTLFFGHHAQIDMARIACSRLEFS